MKRHILDFKENECIHVPTKEEAEWLLNELDKLGLKWISGDKATYKTNWYHEEEKTVYYPYYNIEGVSGIVTSATDSLEDGDIVYKIEDKTSLIFSKVKEPLIRPLEALVEFQTAFKCPVNDIPTLLDKDRAKLRYDLGKEELDEYLEAVEAGDIVDIADSIGDQLFVLMGTAVEHGIQHVLMDIFEEIFRSNMSKLDENGQPIINGENGVYDESRPKGKVLKSPGYYPPNLKQFLNNENI